MRVRKVAHVDARDGEYLIYSFSQTIDRFWVANGWMLRLPQTATDAELGEAVRNAFDSSQQGVATPSPSSNPFDFALRALGLASFSDYVKDTRSVTIESDTSETETIFVTPKRRAKDSFKPMSEDEAEYTSPLGPAELGAAIIKALAVAA